MNNILNNIVIFAAGVGVGVAASWKVISNKYNQIVKEEIQSVKDTYTKKYENADTSDEDIIGKVTNVEESDTDATFTVEPETDEQKEYFSKLDECRYTNYSNKKGGSDQMSFDKPYTIPPSEFGECEYETISLTYYDDGVLTDDMDIIVDDVDDIVGADFASHFGEYEPDSVFVRNDDRKCDFEILLDVRKYYDLHQKEGK